MKPAATFEGLCSDIRLAITTKSRIAIQLTHTLLVDRNFHDESNGIKNIGNNIKHLRGPLNDQNRIETILFTDRRYHTSYNSFEQRYPRNPVNENFKVGSGSITRNKKYFHERSKAYDVFKHRLKRHNKPFSDKFVRQYVVEFEGIPDEQNPKNDEPDEYDQLILDCTLSENDTDKLLETNSGVNSTTYLTSYGNIDGYTAVTLLNDQSVHHAITKISSCDDDDTKYTYISSKHYSSDKYQGIVLDTGAAEWSIAGYGQYKALKEVISQIHQDESRAGEASVQFGEDPPSPTISQRATVIKSAMEEVQRCYVVHQVNGALRMRNGPNLFDLHTLPLDSEVLVWRENNKWTGPFRLLAIDGQSCRVELPNGPTNFRSTVVKPYLRN
ncbi:hypothetical protein K3495_g3658 [Podosphaera aphanis]|nr:hypothetical protein K3495_g3658 [Podosphaera aphanis]